MKKFILFLTATCLFAACCCPTKAQTVAKDTTHHVVKEKKKQQVHHSVPKPAKKDTIKKVSEGTGTHGEPNNRTHS